MEGFASNVLSCQERERLEEELFEARTRGRNLSRLRHLSYRERVASDAPANRRRRQGSRTTRWSTVAGGERDRWD
jgi:hypothetical protein